MAHVYILFFKDKLIKNGPSVIQGDQDALGHPQRFCQAQPWGVQQVPLMFFKPDSFYYMLVLKERLDNINYVTIKLPIPPPAIC